MLERHVLSQQFARLPCHGPGHNLSAADFIAFRNRNSSPDSPSKLTESLFKFSHNHAMRLCSIADHYATSIRFVVMFCHDYPPINTDRIILHWHFSSWGSMPRALGTRLITIVEYPAVAYVDATLLISERRGIMTDRVVKSASRVSRTNLANAARLMVRSIFFLLPMLFAWLKLRNLSPSDIAQLISDASARDVVWKTALIAYFFAWVWGTLWDVGIQERVYLEDPNKGKMPWQAIGIAAVIFIVGAVLVWVDTFVKLVGALALFTIVDHVAWRYLVNFLRPMIQQARDEYTRLIDIIGLEELQLVENQICGVWKWWRGIVGVVWIVVMLVLALVMAPEYSVSIGRINLQWGFIQAASILIWVLLMESWHWYVRITTRVGVDTLENLRDKYTLVPVETTHLE